MREAEFGIIGYGRFGQLLARELKSRGRVLVFDPRLPATALPLDDPSIYAASLADTCAARLLLYAVPIRVLESVIVASAPHVREGAIVADTASVKEWPARWLLQHLPASVDLVATHPLFGPDSAEDGLAGRKIFVAPLRLRHPRSVHRFLRSFGLEVLIGTPEEHDREIADTQALTHWIGRALERFGATPRPLDTVGYRRLLEILHYVSRDSWELFEDMERWNPHAADTRARFLEVLRALDAELPSAGGDAGKR